MSRFMIVTDSSCDVPQNLLEEWGVACIQLDVLVDGEQPRKNNEVDPTSFYAGLRQGKLAKTSAANIQDFKNMFRPILESGTDILYIAFSSGLSTTYQSAVIAAEELREEFPAQTILAVDSLAASLGQGMLVYLAVQRQKQGEDITAVATYIQETIPHQAHWFTVDDLQFLKRGGRISATVALVGSVLGIKPVLHMDDEGHLINVSKVRGRTAALEALADKYGETVADKQTPIFISHGDCAEDAAKLAGILKERYAVDVQLCNFVGPVIGAHSGPGTLALFFIAQHR